MDFSKIEQMIKKHKAESREVSRFLSAHWTDSETALIHGTYESVFGHALVKTLSKETQRIISNEEGENLAYEILSAYKLLRKTFTHDETVKLLSAFAGKEGADTIKNDEDGEDDEDDDILPQPGKKPLE